MQVLGHLQLGQQSQWGPDHLFLEKIPFYITFQLVCTPFLRYATIYDAFQLSISLRINKKIPNKLQIEHIKISCYQDCTVQPLRPASVQAVLFQFSELIVYVKDECL